MTWVLGLRPRVPPEALVGVQDVILLVPGAAPHRTAKRWPAARYGELARRMGGPGGFTVQLIGGPDEVDLGRAIEDEAPDVINLIGHTDLAGVAALGAQAGLAIGNDTGPIHLIAATGTPTMVLFSADSDPELCAPRGQVAILREANLADLTVNTVFDAAIELLDGLAGNSGNRAP